MATIPSTTSPRASYQRVVGRPVASISCTRQVKCVPSGELQCGSMREASQNRPPAAPSSTITQNNVSISHQHGRPRRLAAVGVVALVTVLAACSSGGGDSKQATSTAAPGVSTTAPASSAASTTAAPTTTTLATGPAD